MMNEKIRITATVNGKKYQRDVIVTSDGAYWNVKGIVEKFVAREFAGHKIESISWNYVA